MNDEVEYKFIGHVCELFGLEREVCIPFQKGISSNQLYVIEDEGVRFVIKRYMSVRAYELERWMLDVCAKNKLKTPVCVYSESNEKWQWLVYKYIEGRSLLELQNRMNKEQLVSVFKETGEQLRYFHNLEIMQKPSIEEQICYLKNSIVRLWEDFGHLSSEFREEKRMQRCVCFWKHHASLVLNVAYFTLIIKDFTNKHIILEHDGLYYRLKGIIDFEQAGWGCRLEDFVLLYLAFFLEDPMLENSFLEGYGMILDCERKSMLAFLFLRYALSRYIQREFEFGRRIVDKTFDWLEK